MASPGVDVRIHCEVDERLGAIVSVGFGGAQADAIDDRTTRLAPVSPAVAATMLGETRVPAALDEADFDPSPVVDVDRARRPARLGPPRGGRTST